MAVINYYNANGYIVNGDSGPDGDEFTIKNGSSSYVNGGTFLYWTGHLLGSNNWYPFYPGNTTRFSGTWELFAVGSGGGGGYNNPQYLRYYYTLNNGARNYWNSDVVENDGGGVYLYNFPVINGYAPTQSKWNLSANDNFVTQFQIAPGGYYDLGLYGHTNAWVNLNTSSYTVYFYDDNGSIVRSSSGTLGSQATAPAALTKSGYRFDYWTSGSRNIAAGATFNIQGTESFYPHWSRIYTVSFFDDEGNLAYQYSGTATEQHAAPPAPTKTGHTFDRWVNRGETLSLSAGQTFTFGDYGGELFYPKWTKNRYTLALSAHNGTFPDGTTTKWIYDVEYGSEVDLSLYAAPTRDGYYLYGWDDDSSASYPTSDVGRGGRYTMPAQNKTLYACWVQTFVVRYYNEGRLFATDYGDFVATADNPGSGSGYISSNISGDRINIISQVPTWGGHSFKGWAYTSTATTPAYTRGQSQVTTITADITLYAVWRWKPLSYFYWLGNHGSDALAIASGKPFQSAILASAWNNLSAMLNTYRTRTNQSELAHRPNANSGTQMLASLFNQMVSNFSDTVGISSHPTQVSPRNIIYPSYFDGYGSFKVGLNSAIADFNDALDIDDTDVDSP